MDPVATSRSALFIDSLRRNLDRDHVAALESCLGCGQCGCACSWYLSDGDPESHPRAKAEFLRKLQRRHLRPWSRLLERIGFVRPPAESELAAQMQRFWKCTTCGRCTLACPMGISNRQLFRLVRQAFTESGLSRDHAVLRQIQDGSRNQRHSFSLEREKVQLRMAFHFLSEGVEVPFDVVGRDYLLLCTAVGNTRIPHLGAQVPMLLNAAGVDYTASSRILDTGTDAEFVIADRNLSRSMLMEVEEEASRLEARTLLVSECGCDTRTFIKDAGRVLGRPLRLGVRTLDSLLLELLESGKLPAAPVTGRLTLHDPCKSSRLCGLSEEPRRILRRIASDFVEMTPNRERNLCCNGGSGPLRLAELASVRRKASGPKAEQIRATGAERVATPCTVCMLTLEDIVRHHGLASSERRMSFLLFEIVFEAVSTALARRGESGRFRRPSTFAGRTTEFVAEHGVPGLASRSLAS